MPTDYESWMNGQDREPFDLPDGPTALIVVDMQNSYVMDDLPRPAGRDIEGFKRAVPGCEALVDSARKAGHLIIFTRYMYMDEYLDKLPPSGRATSLSRRDPDRAPDDYSHQLMEVFTPRHGEILLDKSRPSSFYGTRLEPLLTSRGVENVVICGVTTNICVETTARDAHQRGYNTFVVEDACGEFEESRHWHALYTIAWCFGTVVTVADVERSWSSVPAAAVSA